MRTITMYVCLVIFTLGTSAVVLSAEQPKLTPTMEYDFMVDADTVPDRGWFSVEFCTEDAGMVITSTKEGVKVLSFGRTQRDKKVYILTTYTMETSGHKHLFTFQSTADKGNRLVILGFSPDGEVSREAFEIVQDAPAKEGAILRREHYVRLKKSDK